MMMIRKNKKDFVRATSTATRENNEVIQAPASIVNARPEIVVRLLDEKDESFSRRLWRSRTKRRADKLERRSSPVTK